MKKLVYFLPGLALAGALLITGCTPSASAGDNSAAKGSSAGVAAAADAGSQSGIFVGGTGSVKIKPDLAQIRLGVQVTADSAQSAQSQAGTQMDKVVASLKGSGISQDDIKTVEYSIYPYQNTVNGRDTEKGYRATNIVAVTVKDVSKLGAILDAAASAGANRMDSITFTTSNATDAQSQARQLAMDDAKTKAQALAKAAGVTLGKPVSISESAISPVAVPKALGQGYAMASDASTPISPGETEVTVNVSVQYAIQ